MDSLQRTQPRLILSLVLSISAASSAMASGRGEIASSMVSEASYRHYLDDMLYAHNGDDRHLGPEHDLARDNILAIFESFGLTAELEPFPYPFPDGESIAHNVVATKLGTLYPDQEYVIGAHYDSVVSEGYYAPGADDNASGVALILEAARIISQHDTDYTIRFVAFDKEEVGLDGGDAYVDAHSMDDILGMVYADMVAFDVGNNSVGLSGWMSWGTLGPAIRDAIYAYGQGLGVILEATSAPGDNWAFQLAGIPACNVREGSWDNPYIHTPQDSVDTPGYIDYTYATNITRSVVGFLADQLVLHVPIPDADYTGDGEVDEEDLAELQRCYSGPGVPATGPGCSFFDFLGDGDVDCGDAAIFQEAWTGIGDPPSAWQCGPLPAVAAGDGSRCLEITPPAHERRLALLVTGDPEDPAVSCISRYVQADGGMGTDPVFQMSDEWGTVYVCDAEIIPQTAYHVWCDFGEPGMPTLSASAAADTGLWADTAGIFEDGQWGPPNNDQGIVDVVAILS